LGSQADAPSQGDIAQQWIAQPALRQLAVGYLGDDVRVDPHDGRGGADIVTGGMTVVPFR